MVALVVPAEQAEAMAGKVVVLEAVAEAVEAASE